MLVTVMVQFHLWLPFSWAWWGVDWTKVVRGSHKTCHVPYSYARHVTLPGLPLAYNLMARIFEYHKTRDGFLDGSRYL